MRLLVLGGTGFVGRAVVAEALARGDEVTVFNRGLLPPVPGVTALVGDRTAPGGLAALKPGSWDAVVDTWSAAPAPVGEAARLLRGRAGHYGYVSSRSVYAGTTVPLTEDSPVVDPAATDDRYAADKRGGELAALDGWGGDVLLARAGLILGPGENVGRLPWWLNRLARGGPTLAPAPADLALQIIDARDLAVFMLDAAVAGRTGPYNLTGESGHTTMGELLSIGTEVTGGHAELRWTDPQVILDAGVQPWVQLPLWVPEGDDHTYVHRCDVSKAVRDGLRVRPVRETVEDTWAWLLTLPGRTPPQRPDRTVKGLDPRVEAAILSR